MGSVIIRTAGLEDLEVLLQWRMEVLQNVFALPGKPSEELQKANLDYYQKALADGGHFAVFAEGNGNIVGCGGVCFYQEMPSPDNPSGWCGYLMNIYTRAAVRGQGIGTKIVRALLDETARRGIHKVYLETTDQARSLYERIGFTEMKGYLMIPD